MIELLNVRKIYKTKIGETAALDGINLVFPEKGLIFITGKSGSGKTTLLNVVGGLDGFDEGEIVIDGKGFKDLTAKEYDSYRNTFIGVVFQEYNLLPEYTVEKNVRLATELQGEEVTDEKLDELLKMVEIEQLKNRLPSQLSGGQMQRVAIARALIKNPQIILADEPTGALDSLTGIQVIETLKKLANEKLVIVVSHDRELAENYADRIITLKDGKIISDETCSDVVIDGSIYDGKVFYVKAGAQLNTEEKDKLVSAVLEKKEIEIIDKLVARERKETTKEDIKVDKSKKEIKLIESKMKFKSSAQLGIKSLTVKPIRLIATILLAVIAFGLFGVFDAVASYDRQKIIYHNLVESGFNAVVAKPRYVSSDGDYRDLFISQEEIDEINEKTGYNFKGVNSINDREEAKRSTVDSHTIQEITGISTENKGLYYRKSFCGMLEFDNAEITTIGYGESEQKIITEGGFNYKILYGQYPDIVNSEGKIVENSLYDIGISEYMADCILQFSGSKAFVNTNGKISKIEELIDCKIKVDSRTYVIKCIIDCGEIPERYEILKISDKDKMLGTEFESFLYSGAHLNIFTDKGFNEYIRQQNNRLTPYYSLNGISSRVVIGDSNGNVEKYAFNANEIPSENYLTFAEKVLDDTNENVIKINEQVKEGEILVNASKISTLLFEYIDNNMTFEFNRLKAIILNEEASFSEKRDAMTSLVDLISQKSGERILSKDITIQQAESISGKEYSKQFKVVGVYFGVDKDSATGNWVFAYNPTDFDELNIYEGQGFYTRLISPILEKSNARRALSQMMCEEDGLVLSWFNNSVIDMLGKQKDQIEGFFDIFVSVDIILALFAIFMLTNYISTSIVQKRQTIGILRALGSNSKDVFIIFIIESLVIAIINGILATLFGYFGCMFVNVYVKEFMSINVSFALFESRQAIIIFFSSLITAILSSLIPIVNICKKKPVEMIRKSY